MVPVRRAYPYPTFPRLLLSFFLRHSPFLIMFLPLVGITSWDQSEYHHPAEHVLMARNSMTHSYSPVQSTKVLLDKAIDGRAAGEIRQSPLSRGESSQTCAALLTSCQIAAGIIDLGVAPRFAAVIAKFHARDTPVTTVGDPLHFNRSVQFA